MSCPLMKPYHHHLPYNHYQVYYSTIVREMEGCKVSSQKSDFTIFRVNLITDATAIAFGWLRYASDDARAEDARDLLTELAAYLGEHAHIIVLGDRIHTGEPFLERLDELHWNAGFFETS